MNDSDTGEHEGYRRRNDSDTGENEGNRRRIDSDTGKHEWYFFFFSCRVCCRSRRS